MPSVSPRKRLPALLLVLLGVAFVGWSGAYVYDDFRPEYSLTVTHADASPTGAEVLDFRDLSPEAKAAFERARDGRYVVHQRPAWLDVFPLYETVYVRLDGTIYELWARSDGVDGLSLLLSVPVVLLSLVLGALGVRSYRRETVRTPVAVLAALGAAAVVATAWPPTGSLFLGTIPVVPVAAATVATAVTTWVGLAWCDVA